MNTYPGGAPSSAAFGSAMPVPFAGQVGQASPSFPATSLSAAVDSRGGFGSAQAPHVASPAALAPFSPSGGPTAVMAPSNAPTLSHILIQQPQYAPSHATSTDAAIAAATAAALAAPSDVTSAIEDALRPVLCVPPTVFAPALQTPAVAAAAAAAAAVAASEVGNTFADPSEAASVGLAGPLAGQVLGPSVTDLLAQVDPAALAALIEEENMRVGGGAGFSGMDLEMLMQQPAPPYHQQRAQYAQQRMPGQEDVCDDDDDDLGDDDDGGDGDGDGDGDGAGDGDDEGIAGDGSAPRATRRDARARSGSDSAGLSGGTANSSGGVGGAGIRKRRNLPPTAIRTLKAWLLSPDHIEHPYPSEEEKKQLAAATGLSVRQLNNWFLNARKRLWRPMLREQGHDPDKFKPQHRHRR